MKQFLNIVFNTLISLLPVRLYFPICLLQPTSNYLITLSLEKKERKKTPQIIQEDIFMASLMTMFSMRYISSALSSSVLLLSPRMLL